MCVEMNAALSDALADTLAGALAHMILSASGWRGIFAIDGDEESSSPQISREHKLIAACAARVFSDFLSNTLNKNGSIIVGKDTRPTGTAITEAVLGALIQANRNVLYLGITAAPEIMAYTKAKSKEADVSGFIYISASHNPIGHNGIKFGLSDGAVLQPAMAKELISAFRSYISTIDPESFELFNTPVFPDEKSHKKQALAAYRDFNNEVITGTKDKAKIEEFWSAIKKGLEKRPLGIAVDFNGSARTLSIDRDFFTSLGIKFMSINDKPGEIVHRIIPEGESLEPCKALLEEQNRKDPSFILGYMPDCDGDRGNLVIAANEDPNQKVMILEAQKVFALACVAELSSMVWSGELDPGKRGQAVAIAANDPTSLRIDRIAGVFGVKVFRAEVGEANAVGLARKLREEAYLVRFLGEGSVGGIIIHPSEVRDPINTIGATLKLLLIRSEKRRKGPFEIWCNLSGHDYREDFTLSDIIASLPPFTSTSTSTEESILKVKTKDHGLLKERYQEVFLREWEEKKEFFLQSYGISGWEAIAYNGIEEKRNIEKFSEAGTGGLKIVFSGGKAASIWMRGSQTEPVFRVMADAEGSNAELERTLINWQRRMVLEADKNCAL